MRNEIPLFVRNDRCCSVIVIPREAMPMADGGTTEESHPMYYYFFKDDESTAKGLASCCHLLIMPNKIR